MTNESMDKLIEIGIIELIDLFRENPAQFEYEIDLCHQFHDILVEKLCEKNDFKIRWELKSKMTYEGKQPSAKSKYFAKYDISLIKKGSEEVPYAFEFKLFKDLLYDNTDINYFTPNKIKNIKNDFDKLINPDNKVETGYILAFTRGKFITDNQNRIRKFKKKFENYTGAFNELVDLISIQNNNFKIAFVYFGEIKGEVAIFKTLLYPNSFCASVNQKERFS